MSRKTTLAAALAISAGLATPIAGQSTRPEPPPPPVGTPAPGAPAADDVPPPLATPPVKVVRAPLLREGSRLTGVVGTVEAGDDGLWRFVMEETTRPGAPTPPLIVLPSSRLTELERVIEAAPARRLLFEITGEVTAYRGRNYLMLTHPPALVRHEPRDGTPALPTAPAPSVPGSDTPEEIIRELERAVGAIPRRPDAPPKDAPLVTTRLPDPGVGLKREGTLIVDRRGHIARGPGGAYLFVFDADAEGLGDPPMILLPTLLLERLEQYEWQEGRDAAVLLSGDVTTYRGRNYLRPTMFRIPRERTLLVP